VRWRLGLSRWSPSSLALLQLSSCLPLLESWNIWDPGSIISCMQRRNIGPNEFGASTFSYHCSAVGAIARPQPAFLDYRRDLLRAQSPFYNIIFDYTLHCIKRTSSCMLQKTSLCQPRLARLSGICDPTHYSISLARSYSHPTLDTKHESSISGRSHARCILLTQSAPPKMWLP